MASEVEIKILKISKYRGKPVVLHFSIRSISRKSMHIPVEWVKGRIKLNMSRIFSASFQKWFKIEYDLTDKRYQFGHQGEMYQLHEDVVNLIDNINTNYALFGILPDTETITD
jgi:hypothetical protein